LFMKHCLKAFFTLSIKKQIDLLQLKMMQATLATLAIALSVVALVNGQIRNIFNIVYLIA